MVYAGRTIFEKLGLPAPLSEKLSNIFLEKGDIYSLRRVCFFLKFQHRKCLNVRYESEARSKDCGSGFDSFRILSQYPRTSGY